MKRYRVSWFVAGRWERARRTFWTKRGARRYVRTITRNLRSYGVRYDRIPRRAQ